jgi:replication-associated recombination protein RarA
MSLFDGMTLTTPAEDSQNGFDFPEQLTEKYRPKTFADFVGLDKPKKIMQNLAARPRESAWLLVGPSGTGKTSMGLALAAAIPAELHKIPSQECNLANIERVRMICQYVPMVPFKWHLVLADEIDQLTPAAQISLLSKLDATNFFPNTVFIGTCNDTSRLEPRFLSRFHPVEFSSYGLSKETSGLLERIWTEQAPAGAPSPNFSRIVKESNNNVRESLMRLETELMSL